MPPKRILIVDDDLELCDELKETLEAEGYSVEFVNDAVKGEGLIRNGGFDTVLLDVKMPQISGIDILKNLKADDIRKRIFLITGRPLIEQALDEENLSDMVSGIIPKPIDTEILLKNIKQP